MSIYIILTIIVSLIWNKGRGPLHKTLVLNQMTDRIACEYGVSSSNLYALSSDLLCFSLNIFNFPFALFIYIWLVFLYLFEFVALHGVKIKIKSRYICNCKSLLKLHGFRKPRYNVLKRSKRVFSYNVIAIFLSTRCSTHS